MMRLNYWDSMKKQPKVGFRFFHKRVLNPDLKTPMEFVITRIVKGIVYYRPVNGGGSQSCKIEDFDRYASSQKINQKEIRLWKQSDSKMDA